MNNSRKITFAIFAAGTLTTATSCGSDGGDTSADSAAGTAPTTAEEPVQTEPPPTTPDPTPPTTAEEPVETEPPATTAATTSIPATTIATTIETMTVPVYLLDTTYPVGWTCDDAIPGFDVAFSDASGDRTISEARFANARAQPESPNAACAVEDFEGEPTLFMTALLEAPVATPYQGIEIRFPFADGVGSDRYDSVFEMVTAEQARNGLYFELTPSGMTSSFDAIDANGFPSVD